MRLVEPDVDGMHTSSHENRSTVYQWRFRYEYLGKISLAGCKI